MHADVAELRARATRLDAAARTLRDEAARLAQREQVGWTSAEAERWRAELREVVVDLRGEADRCQDAAHRLRRHADEVASTLAAIAAAESWFRSRLSDARRVLAAGVDAVGEGAVRAAEQVVDAARRAPVPGSVRWLDFHD